VTEISDTRRRAELRGRESVARWRIKTGLWAGRVLAAMTVLPILLSFTRTGGPSTTTVVSQLIYGAIVLFAAERAGRGGRWAAAFLLGLFLLNLALISAIGAQSLTDGIVLKLAITFCLAQGVWGTFALARVQRDALLVPPAPPREAGDGPPRRPMFRAES